MDQSPESILKRLEELRCWQTEQQEKLVSKQLSRSELEKEQQRKLCELFGLSITSTVSNLSLSETEDFERRPSNENNVIPSDLSEDETEHVAPTLPKPFPAASPINNFSLKELESYGKGSSNQPNSDIEVRPKRSFLKRGQGLAARFGIHPEKLRIDKLPKYKFANSHRNSKFLLNDNRLADDKPVEVTRVKPFSCEFKLARTDTIERVINMSKEQLNSRRDEIHSSQEHERKTPPVASKNLAKLCTWSKVLESESKSNVDNSTPNTPTLEEKEHKQRQDQRDLQIFELLEQNLNNSGISLDSEMMQDVMKYISSTNNANNQPLKRGAQQKIDFSECERQDNLHRIKQKVRFADEVTEDNDVESDCETLASTDIDELNQSKTSTPITKSAFEMFKQNLLADRIQEDSTLVEQRQKDNSMQLKNEQLKQRLSELQSEIELFRQQNAVLTKSMREHEIEKIQWEERKNEQMEKFEDERMRLEVYLHDERMKLANEQRKLDKRAKELRAPNRKDREEVTKLKQEISDLQRESANKDQKHVSAQARLRAQIRNMEKDLKDYSMEIENLRKENKKIESENMRLRRQNNNKMLNEINKNIAKLAPKIQTENPIQTKPNNGNKSVTDVPSHPDPHPMPCRSKSVPNLIEVKEISKTYESEESESESVSSSITDPDNQRSSYFQSNQITAKLPTNTDTHPSRSDQIPTLESTKIQMNLKREIENDDGSRDIWYANGNIKKISADEMVIRMLYFNKDIKETNMHEGTVKYYYAEANTWQTTYLDGLEIWEFPDGKTEHHFKDGSTETYHPDGSICVKNPNNMEVAEEWKYINGTSIVIKLNGDKYLNLPNGQREVTTSTHIRREYPDGTVKIKYPDGSLETRYSNGRIRIRDASGTLVRDSEN